jgi:cholesterol transport system auxiliary component
VSAAGTTATRGGPEERGAAAGAAAGPAPPSPTPAPVTRRGALLGLAALATAAGGCSVLPERPYQEVQRFALMPERPRREPPPPAAARAPVLLLRLVSAAPGLDQRGLRTVEPNGAVDVGFWSEWTAPPAELAEEALRRWLSASGLFAAVVPPGSRLPADMVMEGELIRLEAEPAAGVARAALSILLLSAGGQDAAGQPRILGQYTPEGTAPLPGGRRAGGRGLPPAEAAAAMEAALAAALAALEADLRQTLAARRRTTRR